MEIRMRAKKIETYNITGEGTMRIQPSKPKFCLITWVLTKSILTPPKLKSSSIQH